MNTLRATDVLPGGPVRVLERNLVAYRSMWYIFAAGLLEPIFFLLSIGVGVGHLVGRIPGPGGHLIDYRDFVAPGLMATAAMNGAVFDTTFMFFIKLKYWGVYESMLATPLGPQDIVAGEVAWAVLRGAIYAGAFLLTMAAFGIHLSWLALLALPAAMLICWAFAGAGVGGSSYMRSYFDFDFINIVIIPSFLFSSVFFPLSRYPGWVAAIVRVTPLYQGVALIRDLTAGRPALTDLVHVVYLAALGATGLLVASRRVTRVLTP